MRREWSGRVLGAALVAWVAAGCLAPPAPVFVVEDVTHECQLYRARVEAGSPFVLSYVHSSEQVPVRGTFVVQADGALVAKETAFAGFGPGLPEPRAEDAWRFENGMIVVPAAGERFPELRIRVAPFTRHRLRAPSGEDVDLSALIAGGGLVRIRVIAGTTRRMFLRPGQPRSVPGETVPCSPEACVRR